MADKKGRGLPETFSLAAADDLPVALGDFLDEEDATKDRVLARRLAARPPAEDPRQMVPARSLIQGIETKAVLEAPVAVTTPIADPQLERPPHVPRAVASEPPKRPALHPAWKRPRRKQLNVSAEAERMLDALLRHFQQYGPQDDIKMSELFEALVIVAHQSMDRLSLGELPRRGAWGSQTEKNFPIAIGQALARAIVEEYAKWREVANG